MKHLVRFVQVFVLTLFWGGAMAQAPYCTPTYSTGCTYGDGLILFQLNTINQPIPCSGTPAWYHDYTSVSTDLDVETPYTLTVQAGYGSTYVDVWIDFNDNDQFDPDEIVVDDLYCSSANTNYTATINLPTGTPTGNHRLRFRTNWLNAVADPCTQYSYGNAADFTVNVQASGGGNLNPVTVTIGTGTTTVGYPYTTYWHDGRTQILVTKDEILAAGGFAGEISDLAFNVSSVNSSYQPMNGFTINVQNYPGSSLTGFVTSGWTTVYQTTYTVQNTGWNTHTFTTPFMWDGNSNLLFEICYDNTSWTSYSYVYASTVASGLCYYRYTDGAVGCQLTSPNSTTNRPNVRFTITPIAPATLNGTVTNAITGTPIIGALVQCGDSSTYTNAAGYYEMTVRAGTNQTVTCQKLGWDPSSVVIDIAAGSTVTQDFGLYENTPAPSVVFASLNTAQTAVDITWGVPQSGYIIIYDDGQFENMTAWAVAGNINALKFTPINQYPVQVTGGMVNIGDGSYPSGNILQPFQMAVYDDDGPLGYPGTELAVVDVTPTHYGWIEFAFNPPVVLQSGDFYIGMIQGGDYPNCAPIAIDETNPSMRSYSRFVTGNAPWVLAGYNDFMIRATCFGAGGPLDLTANSNTPVFIDQQRINKNTYFMKQPRIAKGLEGEAIYKPIPKLNSQTVNAPANIPAPSWGLNLVNDPNAAENTVTVPYGLPLPAVSYQQFNFSDGILFNNGPFVNSPGTGPGGADESIIVAGTNSYGFNFNQAAGYTVADDFTVTGTDPWAVSSVDIFGYQTGSTTTSSFTGGYIRIWDGDPSSGGQVIWGDLTTNRMTSTVWTNCYRVNASGGGTTRPIMKITCSTPGLLLNPGTYWIEFTTTGSLSSGPWVPPVCLSTPQSGNAIQWVGTAWQPIVSGTDAYPQGVPFILNGAVMTGLEYQVWRLKQGEENTPNVWTSLGTTGGVSMTDNSWPTLPNGPYRWAVKAKYTGDRWSDPAFSNILGKGWTSNVTFNITLSSQTAVPQNILVHMQNTSPVADSAYYGLTPASGTINFPHVWKGNYNITIQKFGYETYTENVDITEDNYVFNIMLNEITWAPYNLWVDDRTLMAYWNAPNPQIALFEERWGSGNFTFNQWTVNGGNWSVTSGFGNPSPSAQFNWSPQVTNYEQSIVSKDIVGQGSPGLLLKYDIYLSNFGTTNENQLAVEIWDGTAWNRLKNYTNLGGNIPWTSETVNISAYTWDTFKIRFLAYGTDSYDINNWNIDNIIVAATLGDKSILGYDLYLDDIQIGFTTDTTYQIPHNLCIYGHQYTASVDAAYESGVSERDYYTFTAHYLPAPRNLEASAVQDAAYLTWEEPVMGSKLVVDNIVPRSSMPDPTAEYSPMVAQQHYVNATEAIWDVLFTFNAAGASRPGVETDGTYIYTSQWNGPNFGKFENQGGTWTLVEEFTIAGASNIRDLAYDGTYFYGGSASTTIYKMDFTTQTLVGTIATSGVNVRHIGYDPVNQGFWTGNWSDLYLVDMTGATLQTANVGLSAMYGNAYDGVSAGGPYLWIHDQNGSGVDIHQMSIATMTLTGVMHAATDLPGFLAGSIAGGLASDNGNVVPGKFILLVNVQQDPNLVGAYELAASTGGGGGAPSSLLGYNVYRDGTLIAYVEKPTTEYYDLYLDPGHYCYTVTAVYDLSAYGFPAGTTGESLENGDGPACVDINYGVPIPWTEDWASAGFTYNNWSFAPDQGHWRISNMTGNAVPSAEFTWAPPITDYSYAMISPALNASIFTCADIWLDFDLKLDDRNQTGAEILTVDVYWSGQWHKVAEFKNEGSFNWQAQHIDITQTAGKALKVRFVANGANSADILGWFVDNIHVYPVVRPASNLVATNTNTDYNAYLHWNSPECPTSGPAGAPVMLKQWDGDPTVNPNAYYQQYNYGYGVVYDLSAYPDATLSKIDFHHASWGVFGTWQYKIHVVDWTTYTEIATLGPFMTTGNDIWETDIPLGDIMGYGGGLIGIMMEPMSNQATDAYPCFTADNVGPEGVSLFGPLPDYAGFQTSAVGDFYQNLWILTTFDDKGVVAPRKVPVAELPNEMMARRPIVPRISSGSLTTNQMAINSPYDGAKGVIGYNVYRNGELLNTTPITDTTMTDIVPGNGQYCYVVKAVHEGYLGDIESEATNEVCLDFTVGIENPAGASISVYPNPASDFVNVTVPANIRTVELVNYLGQSIYIMNLKGEGTYRLNTTTYESGVYFLRFTDTSGNTSLERITITR
jgi:hypothetical protein